MKSFAAVLAVQTPRQVEQALETVFARPEFEPSPRSPVWEWLFEAIRAAGEFIRGLFPAFGSGAGSAALAFWLVVGVLALAAGGLAVRLLERTLTRRRSGLPAGGGRSSAKAGVALPETADGWERRARSLAAEGHWREAAMALYQALLHRLDTRGALRFDPSKTPGDYRREVRRDRQSFRLLDEFLRRFEPVAFGGRAADAAVFDSLVEAAELPARSG